MVKRRSLILSAVEGIIMGTMRGAARTAEIGQALPVFYRQGTIVKWDPVTLNNVIKVDGTDFSNLTVLGVAEAASYKVGAKVGIQVVGEQWGIVGRWVVPGSAEATDAVTDIAQRVVTATVAAGEDTTSLTFTDLATFGPQVTIRIGASGQALVIIGADLQANNDGCIMGYDVTGANTISPSANNALFLRTSAVAIDRKQFSLVDPLVGLTPGLTTFTAKYAIATNAGSRLFSRRRLTVVAF